MKNKNYNDFELLYLINRSSGDAHRILFSKYENLIHRLIKSLPVNYQTKEDIIQECKMSLLNAIKSFDPSKNILFYTYVLVIFKRNIKKFWISYYKETEILDALEYKLETSLFLMETRVDYEQEIEKIICNKKYQNLVKELKVFDRLVLNEVMLGRMPKNKFAAKYGIDIKRVYNTIQKIKSKYLQIENNKY